MTVQQLQDRREAEPALTPARRLRAVGERPHTPLRVCMIHFSDYHVDSRIQRQARALAERGDVVDCICLSDDDEIPFGLGRIHLHRIDSAKRRGGARAYLSSYARFFAGARRKTSELDRRLRFDLVEVHNMPDFLTFAARRPSRRGAPLILNLHDTFPELFGSLFGLGERHPLVRAVRAEERLSTKPADALVFVTEEARELVTGRANGPERSLVVMNSPDESLFGPRRPPVSVPVTGACRAIYHGGLAERFGVEPLIEAFGLLRERDPELSLDVFGPDQDRAAELAEGAPRNVRVALEPTPMEAIPGRVAEAQIGIVPTLQDSFTELLLPVKLLECVHMGLPVVASRLPGIERYFSDREVTFCEPGSAESLAAAVEGVRQRPDLAYARALRASERLAEIEWSRQREKYLELVDDLVGSRG